MEWGRHQRVPWWDIHHRQGDIALKGIVLQEGSVAAVGDTAEKWTPGVGIVEVGTVAERIVVREGTDVRDNVAGIVVVEVGIADGTAAAGMGIVRSGASLGEVVAEEWSVRGAK